jgi:hypothetical protein
VPPSISGTEKVKISIMKVTNMTETEQHIQSYLKRPPAKGGNPQMDQEKIKHRYGFAMSAFARMYGVRAVNSSESLHKFCMKWAESEEQTPTGILTEVNFYFKDRWEIWGDRL